MNFLLLFIKGVIIGLFMLVPGISGGSIAILLNLYDDLLINLNDLFKKFRNSFPFLLVVTLGGIVGILASAFILDFFIKSFYFELIYLFLGLMVAYFITLIKKNNKSSILKNVLLISLGVLLGYLLTVIPKDFISFSNKYLNLFFLGIFLAIALILPGVSISYVLLIFSLYDDLILALKTFDFFFLFELGIFLLIGIIIVVKGLNYLIINKKEILENIIMGFIISSIWLILPIVYSYKEFVYASIFIIIGIIIRKLFPLS